MRLAKSSTLLIQQIVLGQTHGFYSERFDWCGEQMSQPKILLGYLQYMQPQEKRRFFSYIGFQFLNGFFEILAILIAGLAVTLGTLKVTRQTAPIYIQNLFDFFSVRDIYSSRVLFLLVIAAAILLILKTVISAHLNLRLNLFLGKVTARTSSENINLLSRVNYGWFKRHDHAAVSYFLGAGITNDLKSILLGIAMLMSEGIFLLTIFCYLLIIDLRIALTLGILIGSASYFVVVLSHGRLRKIGNSEIGVITHNNSEMLAFLRGYKELRVSRAIFRYEGQLRGGKFLEADLRGQIQWLEQVPKFFLEVLIILIGLALFAFAGVSSDAEWGATTLMTFSLVLVRATPSLLRFQTGASLIRFNVTRFSTTEVFLKQVRSEVSEIPTRSLENFKINGDIAFESVSFSYPMSDALFSNLTFQATGPGVTCISGKSGTGKSTILELIVGLIEPESGSVTIDGKSPAAWNRLSGATIYYLPQEVFVFESSLRQNLTLGVTDVKCSDLEILEIMRDVGLEPILADGNITLDSIVGRDLKLSGGERQRLGFARALLSKSIVLILDEPTAALDSLSENQIFSLIKKLGQDRSILMVSHSTQIPNYFDQVITMPEKG
jgi:ABC-type multidrug transport system fused ATPase/permease subunit